MKNLFFTSLTLLLIAFQINFENAGVILENTPKSTIYAQTRSKSYKPKTVKVKSHFRTSKAGKVSTVKSYRRSKRRK